MKELQDEFLAGLAPILNMTTLIKERELLQKLDEYRWTIRSTMSSFAPRKTARLFRTPREILKAAIQGFKPPASCGMPGARARSGELRSKRGGVLGIRHSSYQTSQSACVSGGPGRCRFPRFVDIV